MLDSTPKAGWKFSDSVRIVFIAILSGLFAYASFLVTLSGVLAKSAHPLVAALTPNDPVFLTRLIDANARAVLVQQPSLLRPGEVTRQARRVLSQTPLNPVALRSLGIVRFGTGKEGEGKALVLLASKFSKRDLVTQGWLFERFLRENRPAEAFSALDYALRVHDEVKPVLFPRLAQVTIQSPQARTLLRPYVSRSNPWVAEFVSTALQQEGGARMVEELAREVGGLPDTALFRQLQPEVVRHLIEKADYMRAWEFQRFYDGHSDQILNHLDFNKSNISQAQSAFAWRLGDVVGTYLEFVKEPSSSELQLVVDVSEQQEGVLITKVLMLKSGLYRIDAPAATDAPRHPWVQWEISCLPGGPTLASLAPGSAGEFSIPRECAAQGIALRMTRGPEAAASVYTAYVRAPRLLSR